MAKVEEVNEVEMNFESAISVMSHFIEKAQQKANTYKLNEAGVLQRAISFFKGEEKEMTEIQSVQLLINGLHVGQANGCFTLEEAALIHNKIFPLIQTEMKKRSEKIEEIEETEKSAAKVV